MKGIIVGIVLVIAISTLVVGGIIATIMLSESTSIKISAKSSKVLNSIDFFEGLKRGLDYSYLYSFYQAAYDVGIKSGYKEGEENKEWRKYSETNFPLKYIDNIEEKVSDYISEYFKEIENLVFSKPIIDIYLISEKEGLKEAKMSVYYKDLLTYSDSFFNISDNPNRTITLPLEYFSLYKIGSDLFISKDYLRDLIDEAEKKMDENCKTINLGDICEYEVKSPENILEEKCPNANSKFKEKILSELEKSREFSGLELRFYPVRIEVKNVSNERYDSISESEDCGCKSIDWKSVDNGTTSCNEYCASNNYQYSKFENNDCYCGNCTEYYKKYHNLIYTYKYLGAVKALVNITSKGEYPLFDKIEGTTKLRKFSLKFNVTTSNDYEWKPL